MDPMRIQTRALWTVVEESAKWEIWPQFAPFWYKDDSYVGHTAVVFVSDWGTTTMSFFFAGSHMIQMCPKLSC